MELSFNVTSPADYNHFLQNFVMRMREMLRDEDNPFVVHRIARLREQVDSPDFMDLSLLADGRRITLRVQTDNLYVIGFCNGDGRWFEFNPDDRTRARIIHASTYLGYGGSYRAMGGLRSQDGAILGRPAVQNAIHGLARHVDGDGTHNQDVKGWLRTLIVNFIESVRFDSIADRVAIQMSNPGTERDRNLTERDILLIHNWGSLSGALMMAVNNPAAVPEEDYLSRFHEWGIYDLTGVDRVLGMALVGTAFSACQARQPRSVQMDAIGGGLMLAEVVGVLICNINDQNPGILYGTISVTDGFGTLQLFNRDNWHTQSVGPGGMVDLAYPPRAISGADDFVIGIDLTDQYRVFFHADNKVALGQVAWSSRDTLAGDYNRILLKEVEGEHGHVQVQYTVLTDAVVAVVEVVLVDGDGESAPDVFGSVTAKTTTGFPFREQLEYNLFHKKRDQDIRVPKNTAIPLQRKFVSARLCEKLQVSASLWDADRFPDASPDDQIANGDVLFTPRLAGSDTRDITGAHGKVRVNVTWSISHK